MEKTFSMVSKALNFVEDTTVNQVPRPPLSDIEFRYYCDSVGQIIHQNELRKVIYLGGIDNSLRRVVWKHILNVYPAGLTGKERMDYIKKKSAEYYRLREAWRTAVQGGNIQGGELAYVTSMVRKDVLRTDRLHPFYAGNDDNQNIGALFNVLTTYALNHPSVSYCQGMSDLASPLLVIMCDEAQAYICFCAIMIRMKANFLIDGIAMTQKFSHLSDAIKFYDLEFYNYLKLHQADDLLFCYRWLLLEMKREFAFEDSLRMLEVLWSSLPPNPPEKELALFEREFQLHPEEPAPKSPNTLLRTESPYTKLCALRRQNSAVSIASNQAKLDATKRMNQSLDENACRERKLDSKKHQSLDEAKIQLIRQKELMMAEKSAGDEGEIKENQVEKKESQEETPIANSASVDSINEASEKEEKNPFIYTDSSEDIPSPIEEVKSPDENASKSSGHFSDLKERLAAGKREIMSTLEKLETDYDPLNMPTNEMKPKLVKNFNEFFNLGKAEEPTRKRDEASPDDSDEYFPMTTSMTRDLKIELENLNRQVFGQGYHQQFGGLRVETPESSDKSPSVQKTASNISYFQLNNQSMSLDAIEVDTSNCAKVKLRRNQELNDDPTKRVSTASMNDQIFIWQNPLNQFGSSENVLSKASSPAPNATTPDEQTDIEYDGEIIEMEHGKKSVTPIRLVRKNGQDSRTSSNRNSMVANESDSEESDWNASEFKLNANNPFYEMIQIPAVPEIDELTVPPQMMVNSCEEASELSENVVKIEKKKEVEKEGESPVKDDSVPTELPGPMIFGGGNPFLMFLCLTILLQHRDYIMKAGLDYNEMAMHFDKMVRKHNVIRVLNQARRMYQEYLRAYNEKIKSKQ